MVFVGYSFIMTLQSHPQCQSAALQSVCVGLGGVVCALFQNAELKKICSFRNLGNSLFQNTFNLQ